jgi:hypothetical protein
MLLLHLDVAGRSTRVGFQPLADATPKLKLTQSTTTGPLQRQRTMSGLSRVDLPALTPELMIAGDPEIDIAQAGRRLDVEMTAAFFDPTSPDPKPIGDFQLIDLVLDVAGKEKERRPHVTRTPNFNDVHPVKIVRRFPLAEALTSFLFRQTWQLVHEDGLTFEFLHQLAQELYQKQEMALLGAGPKGNAPLVVREAGTAFRAFLSGEVQEGPQGPEYKLLVMLSDQELKRPVAPATPAA